MTRSRRWAVGTMLSAAMGMGLFVLLVPKKIEAG
jgi:hypothetical protein